MVNITEQLDFGGKLVEDFMNDSRNSSADIYEDERSLTTWTDLLLLGIGLFIIGANVFTSFVLLKCRRMSIQIKSLSLCLNSADICIGLFLWLRMITDKYAALRNNIYVCYSVFYGFRTATFVSLVTLASFAVDRALSLVFAMRYYSNVTTNTSFVWCVTMWITSLTLTFISFREGFSTATSKGQDCFTDPDNNALGAEYILVTAFICFVLICISYAIIFRKVSEYIGKISPKGHNAPSITKSRYHYRAATKILILILLFVVCFTPSAIYKTVVAFKTELKYNTTQLRRIVGILYTLNSCVNPVMYAWRFKECRLHCKALICFWNKTKLREIRRIQMLNYCSYLQSSDNDNTKPTTGGQAATKKDEH